MAKKKKSRVNILREIDISPDKKKIIVLKRPPKIGETEWELVLQEFALDLQSQGMNGTVIGVDRDDDISELPVEEMNALGWFHKSQIAVLVKDFPKFKDLVGQEE